MEVSWRYLVNHLYITENGITIPVFWNSDNTLSNPQWVDFLKASTRACGEPLLLEILLRGYFVWPLKDSFAWTKGYPRRSGLVSLD